MFQRYFIGVLRVFKEITRVTKGKITRVTKGNFEHVSMRFQGYFMEIVSVFQECFILHITHHSYPSRRRACLT